MNKGARRLAFLTVIVVIVFAVTGFLMPVPKTAVYWVCIGFMVLAFLLMVFVLRTESGSESGVRSRFYGYPVVKVAGVYLVLQLLVSIFFMLGSKWFPVWPAVASSLVFFVVAAIGVVADETGSGAR